MFMWKVRFDEADPEWVDILMWSFDGTRNVTMRLDGAMNFALDILSAVKEQSELEANGKAIH